MAVRSVLCGPDPELGGVPEEVKDISTCVMREPNLRVYAQVIGDRVVGWGASRPAQSNSTRSGRQVRPSQSMIVH